ncbi:hypothetical protein ACVWYH_000021 [Bradyrhizobium sp. GM24.11]
MQRFGRCKNVELRRRLKSAGRCRRSGPGPPSPQPPTGPSLRRAIPTTWIAHGTVRALALVAAVARPARLPSGRPMPRVPDGIKVEIDRSRLDMQRLWSRRRRPNPSIAPTDRLDRHVYLVLKILERAPAAPGVRRTKPIQTSRQSCSTSSPVTATTERDFQNHRPARRCSTMSFVARLVELGWELLTVACLF